MRWFFAPALAACLAPSGGCALIPIGGGATVGQGGGPTPAPGLRDFRVAFHCHSHLSHDSEVPFDRIAATARALGFNAVLLADHYRPGNVARSPQGFWDGVLFVPGVEIRPSTPGEAAKERGSLLVFGLDRDFDPSQPRARLLEELRGRGALAAAGHAEEYSAWDLPLDAFEVYNLHAQFSGASRLKIALRLLFLLQDRFFEGAVDPPRPVLDLYDRELARGRRLAPLAGHDAHENIRLLGPLGGSIGTYPQVLRLFSNHVLARDLETGALLDALRRGRTYVSFDFLGDPRGFWMSYGPQGATGEAVAIVGDDAPFRPDSVLEVRAPADAWIRVIRDGATWVEHRGTSFAAPVPGPGSYRVEIDRPRLLGRRLWILSAPIRVEEWKA
jgi:hypothetical protein